MDKPTPDETYQKHSPSASTGLVSEVIYNMHASPGLTLFQIHLLAADKTVQDIVISGSNVYALTTSGRILMRCEVTADNPVGLRWAKVPGELSMMSGTTFVLACCFCA